ncbi:amidohydrolase family protein [Catenulispora sp. NL8]|uniref:Amidohydrolase family protein n=1 Tax=Catenulispora pinistramenti TaxID=2705254 RepID=A0ABS5L5P1_9ACTN|nr:amidohydrolase family protein [Catenulispora pinistramenti]MBS2553534.1 amidohydrolase family protein [Catenulispora pinistramenti]
MIIKNVTVIDGTGTTPRPGMDVLIDAGRFADIRPTGTGSSGASGGSGDEPVLDGRDGYLLPGLWETHTHLTVLGMPVTEIPASMRETLAGYLQMGITSVCDLGGLYLLPRSERETGRANGTAPAVFCARAAFTGVNGWPANSRDSGDIQDSRDSFPEPVKVAGLENGGLFQIDDADTARRHVQELLDKVDYIKCMFDGATGGTGRRLPRAALDAIIDATHEAGKKVLVHIATGADLVEAVQAGADCIEHSPIPRDPADLSEAEQLAEVLAEAGTHYCPTIVTWEQLGRGGDPEYLDELIADGMLQPDGVAEITARPGYGKPFPHHPADKMKVRFDYAMHSLHLFHEAGVKLVAGSDIAPVLPTPAHALLRELQLFAKAGLPCGEIIATATSRAAEKIGKRGSMGTITVGADADAILLDADPLTDIAHLIDPRHHRAVISAGHLVHR